MKRRTAKLLHAAAAALLTGLLSSPGVTAQDVVISEILAVNDNVLADEDGDYPDWIELYNAGSTPVDLGGYYLTDLATDLTRWRLPSFTLAPGEFRVIFCSRKNRNDPSGELHTNFRLEREGEYLALIAPDGTTPVFEYAPAYPPQVEDISYGLAMDAAFATLVREGDEARVLIPENGNLGTSWTQPGFNDSSWRRGPLGVGYDRNPTYRPYIGLDVGPQMDGVNTTAYIRIPFTLDDPSLYGGLRLRVRYDDGFAAYLNGVLVASRNAPSDLTWNSSATGLHDDNAAVVFEEFDISAFAGELRAGTNVLAIHGLNDNLGSSDFLISCELEAVGGGSLQRGVYHYFPQPSPGFDNLPGYEGVAERPVFSRQSGVFTSNFSVTLTTSTEGAQIRYTTDRSIPTESSPLYTGPINVTSSVMIRARTFAPGLAPSPVVTRTFLKLAADVRNFTSNLPVMVIDSFGGGLDGSQIRWTPVFAAVMEPGQNGRTSLNSIPTLSSLGAIKIRGSSSAGFPKKNYTFELRDDRERDLDLPLLGMPAESDWVLHGPYSDKTLMRNYLAYRWSNLIGRYAPRTRFVELYLNLGGGDLSAADYAGVYLVVEKIKRGPDRVDVEELLASDNTEPAITGGYIIKKDRLDPGDSGFRTSRGHVLGYVDPKEENITSAQRAWLKNYLDSFESVLYGSNFRDPVRGYRAYIDPDSFIDHHILTEFMKNIDGFRLSTYMFKDRGGKLNLGPLWDFNLSLGNANYLEGWLSQGWYWQQLGDDAYPWYRRLFQDPDFAQRYIDRWTELRRTVLRTAALLADIDSTAAYLSEAQVRNFQKWRILGTYVWPNWFIGDTYEEEISFMKSWLQGRLAWMDSLYTPPVRFNRQSGPLLGSFDLTMVADEGTIYYTLDGTDPRARGGSVSPSARIYSDPIEISVTTRVIARARTASKGWSGPTDATFWTELPPLVITEINYHPHAPPAGSTFRDEDYEFLELFNAGNDPLPLAGFVVGGGIRFTFTEAAGVLEPGEYVVLVRNLAAFEERYGDLGIRIAGEYDGKLANAGEEITLHGPLNEPILAFSYSDTWYPLTDGAGYSLVIRDPYGPLNQWGDPESWAQSSVIGGTPGADDPGLPTLGGRQLPGDSNQDGVLDISDALSLLRRLFIASAIPPCQGATLEDGGNLILLDLNGDGGVDLPDVVYLLNYLFRQGPPPAAGATCIRIDGCPSTCRS